MKILIASDSFKGCCSSLEAAEYMKGGVLRVFPEANIDMIAVADGGEGTLNTVITGHGGDIRTVNIRGAMGEPLSSRFGLIDNGVAIIEIAEACGLIQLKTEELNPLIASSYGVGELIKHAMDEGCSKIYIGLGGSSTNDAGSGMLEALGARFYDNQGGTIHGCGGALDKIETIDLSQLDKRLENTEFIVMSDVNNPLYGKFGASNVFGKQKGADDDMVWRLDDNLRHFAAKSVEVLYKDFSDTPGAGAAGGLGFALVGYLGAKVRSGIESLLELIEFDKIIDGCDIVISGEGNFDKQSLYGKVPVGIAKKLQEKSIPLIVIAGGIGKDTGNAYDYGITSVISGICRVMELNYALTNPDELLPDAAERAMRMVKMGMDIASS